MSRRQSDHRIGRFRPTRASMTSRGWWTRACEWSAPVGTPAISASTPRSRTNLPTCEPEWTTGSGHRTTSSTASHSASTPLVSSRPRTRHLLTSCSPSNTSPSGCDRRSGHVAMVCAAPLPRVPNTDAIGVASTSDFEALRSLVRRHVTRRNTREWLRGYVEATLRAGPLSFPVSQQRELREALGDEVRLSHLQAEAEGAYAEAEDALHRRPRAEHRPGRVRSTSWRWNSWRRSEPRSMSSSCRNGSAHWSSRSRFASSLQASECRTKLLSTV